MLQWYIYTLLHRKRLEKAYTGLYIILREYYPTFSGFSAPIRPGLNENRVNFILHVRYGLAIYRNALPALLSLVRSGLAISRIDCLQLGDLSVLDFPYFGMLARICPACPLWTCLLCEVWHSFGFPFGWFRWNPF